MLISSVIFFLVLILIISAYTLYKVRRVDLFLLTDKPTRESENLFRQLEALQGLYVELGLKKSLPPTRGWAASPDFLLALVRHAVREKPEIVVECSSGTSTIVLARCLQLNGAGKVYSLENDRQFADKTRQDLEAHGLLDWAEVIDAPLCAHQFKDETWPWYSDEALPKDLKIDMLAIDGPPSTQRSLARYPAGPVLFPRLADKASVFLDDAGRVDEQMILKIWEREFPMLKQSSIPCEKGGAVLQKGVSPLEVAP